MERLNRDLLYYPELIYQGFGAGQAVTWLKENTATCRGLTEPGPIEVNAGKVVKDKTTGFVLTSSPCQGED